MVRQEMLGLVVDARARANQRHVAPKDVDQLRQLVKARPSEPAAALRHGLVALELVETVHRRRNAGIHRALDVLAVHGGIDVDLHRPELQGRELALVLPEPCLTEEDGAGRVALHAPRDVREQRRRENQGD